MLLDTSALVEYFLCSERGIKVSHVLQEDTCYISVLTLAELTSWCIKQKVNPSKFINKTKAIASVLDLSEDIAQFGGLVRAEQRLEAPDFSLIDALIYATAKLHGLKLLTKDTQFSGLDSVELL